MDNQQLAFPAVTNEGYRLGMTLRDYFAGQYLAGIMACPIDGAVGTRHDVAASAYAYADAMMLERLKSPK